MPDDLPSATPEKSGDNKAAINNSGNEHSGQPQKKLYPPQRKKRKQFPLTKLEWGEFFVDIYVTLWVWSDFIVCGDIKRIIFLLATVSVAHGVLCYFISKLFNSWRWALLVWFALSFTVVGIAYNNSRPLPATTLLPKKSTKFRVILNTSDSPHIFLELTNEFLKVKQSPIFEKIRGDLIVPAKSKERLPVLKFALYNDSDFTSKPIEVSFCLGTEFDFDAPGWQSFTRETDENAKSRSVVIKVDSIFPKNGQYLPDINLKNCFAISNNLPERCFMQIMPEDRNDMFIAFWLYVPITTNLTKPCIVLATNGVFNMPIKDPN